jgi:hypothetical protein
MPKNPRSRKREAELNEMAQLCGFATRDKLLSYLLGRYRHHKEWGDLERISFEGGILKLHRITDKMKDREDFVLQDDLACLSAILGYATIEDVIKAMWEAWRKKDLHIWMANRAINSPYPDTKLPRELEKKLNRKISTIEKRKKT